VELTQAVFDRPSFAGEVGDLLDDFEVHPLYQKNRD
jgi:hypothetical protein